MRGTYLKLAGFDGPTSISSTAIAPGGGPFPVSALDNVFDRAEYYYALSSVGATAFTAGTSGAAVGKLEAAPVGLNLTGSTSLPPLLGAFLQGQAIPKAFLYTTDIGGPGGKDWVVQFTVFGRVVVTQVTTYVDSPTGNYGLQFSYGAIVIGQVATPGAAPVTTGWNFVKAQPWDGTSPVV